MIHLYTENLFWQNRAKNIVKKIIGKQASGPQGVLDSLKRGLAELNQSFSLDKKNTLPIETACVLSGVKTLAWAIRQKKQGRIKKIVAGPNIVTTPLDHNNIIQDPNIDIVLSPSQWVINWWLSLAPNLKSKLHAWPAGVKDIGNLRNPKGKILIFQKNAPKDLLESMTSTLESQGKAFEIMQYGKLSQQAYYSQLSQTNFLIYLSSSESQGLALQEAWMANVPSLVWNPGKLKYQDFNWSDDKLSAPYQTQDTGLFFKGKEDFSGQLMQFINNLPDFKPRDFVLQNLTDKICSQKYLEFI